MAIARGETAVVVVRPIRLFPATLLLGLVLDHLLPLPSLMQRVAPLLGLTVDQPLSFFLRTSRIGIAHSLTAAVAGGLVLGGIVLFAAGVRSFRRAATPLATNQPSRVLVTTGVYEWTRNPVYLGFFLIYLGVGMAVHSPWCIALTLPVTAAIRYGVVAREERYLEMRFGDAYREYKTRIPRWL